MANELYHALRDAGEYYAAELVVNTDRSPLYRYSRAAAAFFEHTPLTPYDGGRLYPCGAVPANNAGNASVCVKPEFSYTYSANLGRLSEKVPEAAKLLAKEFSQVAPIRTPHTVGGAGYTHSFINFRRILADGLRGYRARVERLPDGDFRGAMLVLLDGIEIFRRRCLAYLEESGAPAELTAALNALTEKEGN